MYRIVLPEDGVDIVWASWADSLRVARLNAPDAQRKTAKNSGESVKNINYILFVASTPEEFYKQFRQLKP